MSQAWFTFPRVDNYGAPDPYGGFPKPDSNIQVPDNYPITALLPGTVTGINSPSGSIPDWGAVVTIRLDSPLNPLATHEAYLHLSKPVPGLAIGSHVNAGDLIGYSGGSNAAGSQKVPVGFALVQSDYYGFGNWTPGNALLNPVPLLNAVATGEKYVPNTVSDIFTNIGASWSQLVTIVPAYAETVAIYTLAILLIIIGMIFLAGNEVARELH